MNQDFVPIRRRLEITNELGLHLRPAERFARLAGWFEAEIRVWSKGQSHDGRSVLDLVMLAAERGTQLEIEAVGPDAAAALEAITALVAAEFEEDEDGELRPPTVRGVNGDARSLHPMADGSPGASRTR